MGDEAPAKKRSARTEKRRVDRSDVYRDVDFRAHPERYRIGRGEEGVLTAEPYKSELLPLWRFRTPAIAEASSKKLLAAFARFRAAHDFVGLDMARKFLQMGYTRARRYANHPSGTKYASDGTVLPRGADEEKAAAAEIFLAAWRKAEADPLYKRMKAEQRAKERAGVAKTAQRATPTAAVTARKRARSSASS